MYNSGRVTAFRLRVKREFLAVVAGVLPRHALRGGRRGDDLHGLDGRAGGGRVELIFKKLHGRSTTLTSSNKCKSVID